MLTATNKLLWLPAGILLQVVQLVLITVGFAIHSMLKGPDEESVSKGLSFKNWNQLNESMKKLKSVFRREIGPCLLL